MKLEAGVKTDANVLQLEVRTDLHILASLPTLSHRSLQQLTPADTDHLSSLIWRDIGQNPTARGAVFNLRLFCATRPPRPSLHPVLTQTENSIAAATATEKGKAFHFGDVTPFFVLTVMVTTTVPVRKRG